MTTEIDPELGVDKNETLRCSDECNVFIQSLIDKGFSLAAIMYALTGAIVHLLGRAGASQEAMDDVTTRFLTYMNTTETMGDAMNPPTRQQRRKREREKLKAKKRLH